MLVIDECMELCTTDAVLSQELFTLVQFCNGAIFDVGHL